MRRVVVLGVLALWAGRAAAQPEAPPAPASLEDKLKALEDEVRELKRVLAARPAPPPAPSLPAGPRPDVDSLARLTPDQVQEGGDRQLRFLAYFFTKGEVDNFAPENDLLQGRLVGRLFGPNTTATGGTSTFAEQRLIPFVIFEPKILDGFARLRASFEINWTWGDSSYGVGGNFGAALSGRGVNLQTQNVHVELRLPFRGWFVNVGLMRLWDNARDAYRTFFSTMSYTGTRLAFWGSDAVGVQVHGSARGQIFKFGFYDLYENKINADDNVLLFEALTSRDFGHSLSLGAHARYLRDTSNGLGGVSVLGQGPNSRLVEYNGGYRFPLGDTPFEAHVVWAGLDFAYNPEFTAGRLGASAFVVGNFGTVLARTDAGLAKAADIAGVAANLRLGYRYGSSRGSHIVGEAMFTSGDPNGINDQLYTGVMTGNTWGAPAAIYVSHGAYLLLPHANVVNRLTTAVFDISNAGYGLMAGTLNASYDLVRNVLTGKLGVAAGGAPIAPSGGGHFIGFEANAALVYRPKVWLTIEAHGAYLKLGDFFDSSAVVINGGGRPADPWLAFLAVKWLLF
jgi:hypothetical protein